MITLALTAAFFTTSAVIKLKRVFFSDNSVNLTELVWK